MSSDALPDLSRTVPVLRDKEEILAERFSFEHKTFFSGAEWRRDTTSALLKALPEPAQTDTVRKRPMAVVRMARGGKTRALKELANSLREADVVAIYISFNDTTPFVAGEQLKEAVLRRISFALSGDVVPWKDCGAADVDTWLSRCSHNVVLLIDELNKAIRTDAVVQRPEEVLWDYLKGQFLVKGRMLVFSSHVNVTVEQVMRDFMPASGASGRDVLLLFPPLLRDEDMSAAACEFGMTTEKLLLLGRVPAHAATASQLASRLSVLTEDINLHAFATVCLDGSQARLVSTDVSAYGMVDGPDPGSRRLLWTPFAIGAILGNRGYQPLYGLVTGQPKAGSGEVWEYLVLLAVLLNRLARRRDLLPALPAAVSSTRCELALVPGEVRDMRQLLKWTADHFGDGRGSSDMHLVVYPLFAAFPVYDVLELVRERGKWRAFCGYQMRTKPTQPAAALIRGKRFNWLLAYRAPSRTKDPYQEWTYPERDKVSVLLGDSLSRVLQQQLEPEPAAPAASPAVPAASPAVSAAAPAAPAASSTPKRRRRA